MEAIGLDWTGLAAQVAGSTLTESTASNHEQIDNLTYDNSASYAQRDDRGLVAYVRYYAPAPRVEGIKR